MKKIFSLVLFVSLSVSAGDFCPDCIRVRPAPVLDGYWLVKHERVLVSPERIERTETRQANGEITFTTRVIPAVYVSRDVKVWVKYPVQHVLIQTWPLLDDSPRWNK